MICLVTDRRRLAGTGASSGRARQCLVAQTRYAVEAEVDLIQVRERDLPAAELALLVREMIGVARGSRTRVIVNDRLDVALACGAGGVQLRGDSMAVGDARRIAPKGFVIGRSVHSADEAVAAQEADFLIAGTVFPSLSKDDSATLLGVDGLQSITRRVPVPVLGIGGVTEARLEDLARTGAAGCAAIGVFVGADEVSGNESCRAVPLSALVDRMRRRFDNRENRSLT